MTKAELITKMAAGATISKAAAGKALEANVVGAAIATEGDKFDLVADLTLLLERAVHSLDPGHGCSRVLKRAVHPGYLPCRIF